MITVNEAKQLVYSQAKPLGNIWVPLVDAAGMVAGRPSTHFQACLMPGLPKRQTGSEAGPEHDCAIRGS